jgi:hypothetical protein
MFYPGKSQPDSGLTMTKDATFSSAKEKVFIKLFMPGQFFLLFLGIFQVGLE